MTAKKGRKTKAEVPPGKELTQQQIDRGTVMQNRYRPNAKYSWAAGQAMSRFLEEMQAGRLIARKCHACARTLFPPRMFCEQCFRPTDEWVPVKDTGRIETFSISYLDRDAKRITEPIFVGVVSVDGASPLMGMMHYFGEVTKESIHIGMKVEAKWRPPEQRVGSVLDIEYWRPVQGGSK